MRRVEVTKINGNTATVVISDLNIQKEAVICRGVTVSVGDTAIMVFSENFSECAIVGVI